ncbi:hypothetical protein SS1G_03184 [Sclerotinia sclerotiorum 1980 UF-70]|uniref:Metallo-beta-lactamase domain-containing protein n=2 Tax=Sclerotinia sclerotiorum (strain ATCC 18683 / 1980 / Ss-1) TaxID=665079 RepID=A7ECZ5_SCLS1|nr:hypothetical protein SS1G_03184 [Sclerotinia sclerotiorum 1980 UF-70]APA11082.1 hypothetical protein sscle_07g058520 [Sclerotinia sclerotiorum 1980 UF-70]EDO00711.1 hypothetical protein SS1G_03184 [Sclerotinia sclerotiorum 1980 UF-70]
MSDKLVPSDPEKVMVIRDVTSNITTLSVPFSRFGMIKIGGRATIVRLTSGQLAVFSPVALTPSVSTKLQSLGNRVAYVAAPDLEHHIFLSDWHSAYPNAHFIAPEGLAEKRAQQSKSNPKVTNIHFQTIFTQKNKAEIKISEEFDADFDYEYVDAHPNKELVFYYKPDRTLIEADLMFNLPATEQYSKTGENPNSGWATKLFGGIMTTKGAATWHKRMQWYAFSKNDRTGFNQSVKRINSWGFENIVPCHGDTIMGNGKEIFEKVFAWHLQGKKSG